MGTRSFALIVDDPDVPDPAAPRRTWVHWVLYNLPGVLSALPAGADPVALFPGVRTALNDSSEHGYGSPCPPVGRHRYFHRLYALDTVLPDLGPSARKPDVEKAMAGHVLAEATLVGTYERSR